MTDYKTQTTGLVGHSTKTEEIRKGYAEYFHIINDGKENLFLVDGCKWTLDGFLIE